MKKDGLFDVAIGAYNCVEVCKLVGTFLLDKISEKCYKNSIGLYRDDGCQYLNTKEALNLKE